MNESRCPVVFHQPVNAPCHVPGPLARPAIGRVSVHVHPFQTHDIPFQTQRRELDAGHFIIADRLANNNAGPNDPGLLCHNTEGNVHCRFDIALVLRFRSRFADRTPQLIADNRNDYGGAVGGLRVSSEHAR